MTDSNELIVISQKLSLLFPDLAEIAPLNLLGEGFSSLVIETAGGVVFRIGRNPTATAGHAREIRLLPHLAGPVSIPIPMPRWYTGPSEAFPFGVIGYPKLSGRPLLPEMLAKGAAAHLAAGVAAFLLELHSFPTQEALDLGLPGPAEQEAEREILRNEILPPLRQALTGEEYETVVRWWDSFLGDPALKDYLPRLQHGDLWYENILVDETETRVAGILDFEHAAVSDPAQDFATLLYLGHAFISLVIEAYQAGGGDLGENFSQRLAQFWALREFGGVQFSVRYNDSEELRDSVHKLRQGPILRSG